MNMDRKISHLVVDHPRDNLARRPVWILKSQLQFLWAQKSKVQALDWWLACIHCNFPDSTLLLPHHRRRDQWVRLLRLWMEEREHPLDHLLVQDWQGFHCHRWDMQYQLIAFQQPLRQGKDRRCSRISILQQIHRRMCSLKTSVGLQGAIWRWFQFSPTLSQIKTGNKDSTQG